MLTSLKRLLRLSEPPEPEPRQDLHTRWSPWLIERLPDDDRLASERLAQRSGSAGVPCSLPYARTSHGPGNEFWWFENPQRGVHGGSCESGVAILRDGRIVDALYVCVSAPVPPPATGVIARARAFLRALRTNAP